MFTLVLALLLCLFALAESRKAPSWGWFFVYIMFAMMNLAAAGAILWDFLQ